jgi:hypothetical protein
MIIEVWVGEVGETRNRKVEVNATFGNILGLLNNAA